MRVKKEVTVAIIISLILGIVIVGGVLRARQALTNLSELPIAQKFNHNSPEPSAAKGFFLTLSTPDNQVLNQPTLTLTGKTLPATYIVINGEAGDSIIVPNNLGDFSQDVSLVKGANTIRVTVYQEDGTKQEAVLNAVYSTTEI